MTKLQGDKQKKVGIEPCRSCGIEFGADERSFRLIKGKKPICFDCEIRRLPKKSLITALSILSKR